MTTIGRRFVSLLATSAAVVLALLPEAAPAHGVKRACPPAHARVLASNSLAVAYSVHYEAFFCNRRSGRRFDVGDLRNDPNADESSCSVDVDLLRLAGRYAAWTEGDFCNTEDRFYIGRLDLASGKSLRGEPTGTTPPCPTSVSCGSVGIGFARQLVIDSRASIAWIAGDDTGDTEVWRYDGHGRRRLAAGTDIDRNFLRVRHHVITWRQQGTLHQASLRP